MVQRDEMTERVARRMLESIPPTTHHDVGIAPLLITIQRSGKGYGTPGERGNVNQERRDRTGER